MDEPAPIFISYRRSDAAGHARSLHEYLSTRFRGSGERESGTARLEEAVAAYREALKEYTRERAPLDWAATQNNLGATLFTLGERTGEVSKLKVSRNAIEAAFEIYMLAGQEQYRAYFQDRLREMDRKVTNLTQDSSA